jgi:ABC-2 type transport system permease protein
MQPPPATWAGWWSAPWASGPHATVGDWAGMLALVVGYVLALSAITVVWGLLLSSTQAAQAFSFIVLFLPYLSDSFVPAATMPSLLRGVAQHQPIPPLVATARALLLERPLGNAGWTAAAWLTAAVVLTVPTAALLFPPTNELMLAICLAASELVRSSAGDPG